jgi:hypothetical protein
MRKLGSGQSIIFYMNKEIESKIRKLPYIQKDDDLQSRDIILWSMSETWAEERRSISAWAVQGARYDKHMQLWNKCKANPQVLDSEFAAQFLEPEATTLDQLYKASLHRNGQINRYFGDGAFSERIVERYDQFEGGSERQANLAEEQEREVAPEVHSERQVQASGPPEPSKHNIHEAVKGFVHNGLIADSGAGFQWAFHSLLKVFREPLQRRVIEHFPKDIRVTRDFAKVVQDDRAEDKDQYQRVVKYILIGRHSEEHPVHIVIISPFEANVLWDDINKSEYVTMCIYSARQTLGSENFDHLSLVTIPSGRRVPSIPKSARISLNLFAGQLYFKSYDEYMEVCRYLGIAWFSPPEGMRLQPDGFVPRISQSLVPREYLLHGGPWTSAFTTSPVPFLKALMEKIRYTSSGIDKTHMGKLLGGVILGEEEFRKSRKRRADEMGEEDDDANENGTGDEDAVMAE